MRFGLTSNARLTNASLQTFQWLLSEQEGRDVGEEAALAALAARQAPSESAAQMVVAETATASFPEVRG